MKLIPCRRRKIGGYKVRGRFGERVFACEDADGHTVAVKRWSFRYRQDAWRVEREIATQWRLDHDNIVRVLGHVSTRRHVLMRMEMAGGGVTLHDRIACGSERVSGDASRGIFRQLVCALNYLHVDQRLSHGDVTPRHLILCASPRERLVKLFDFRHARLCCTERGELIPHREAHGARHYAAREISRKVAHDCRCGDVWSAALCLAAMFANRLEFDPDRCGWVDCICEMIVDEPCVCDVIRRCLHVDPCMRFTTTQILAHPLLN